MYFVLIWKAGAHIFAELYFCFKMRDVKGQISAYGARHVYETML